MAKYKFRMTVLMMEDWEYEVEADSLKEARKKAEDGETTSEVLNSVIGVHERTIEDE